MLMNRSGDGVQVSGAGVGGKRLPLRKRAARALTRGIDIGRRSLRHRCNLLPGSRIGRLQERAFDRRTPRSIDEVAETLLMAVEPEPRILRIFGRGAVFHGQEFFSYAHERFPLSFSIFALGLPYAIGCR